MNIATSGQTHQLPNVNSNHNNNLAVGGVHHQDRILKKTDGNVLAEFDSQSEELSRMAKEAADQRWEAKLYWISLILKNNHSDLPNKMEHYS